MKNMVSIRRFQQVLIQCCCLLALTACAKNYAPVSDQGEVQEITAALIFDSSTRDNSASIISTGPTSAAIRTPRIINSVETAQLGTHRVSAGETLYSIAFQHDLDFRRLASVNALQSPYVIYVDQQLNLNVDGASSSNTSVTSILASPVTGQAVSNNAVARSLPGSSSNGLLRRSISNAPQTPPQWQWPVRGRLLSAFQGSNKGIDIAGNVGDAVYAASAGVVVYRGNGVPGSGDLIIVRHTDSLLSAYAHNNVMLVNEGARVRGGEKIAELGLDSQGTA